MEQKNMPVVALNSSAGIEALKGYFANGEVPKVGQRFELVCYSVEGDGKDARVRFNLSPIEVPAESVSPVIYRYLRPQDYGRGTDSPHNLGGITFAFVIDYAKRVVSVGTAICDDDWNFSKSEGRRVALENLKKSPIMVEFDPKISLVTAAAHKVFTDKSIRAKNPKLAKVLFKTFMDRLGK